jgi:hypothetical protein
VVIILSEKYLAITIPAGFGVLYFIQKYYLRTLHQIRLVDIEAKALPYTTSINGVETIRAFEWQRHYEEQNCRLLDVWRKPFYLLYCI